MVYTEQIYFYSNCVSEYINGKRGPYNLLALHHPRYGR
jgi:hypothetical protein